MITILIAHVQGMSEVLRVCLASLARHDAGCPFKALVLTDGVEGGSASEEAYHAVHDIEWADWAALDLGTFRSGSDMHGKLLDAAIPLVKTDFILTLDSDCFPVADGWLADLMNEYSNDSVLPGIKWPWIPMAEDEEYGEIERRIRKYHNWNNTQVACQLVSVPFLKASNLKYASGDDTGFALLDKVHEMGLKVGGWMPTKCALPSGDLNPELNRVACVVFGDKIFHMGGASRKAQGAEVDSQGFFDEARARVLAEKGAEWILEDGNHHKYRLNEEVGVVRYKMDCMYSQMKRYLEFNSRLFDVEGT